MKFAQLKSAATLMHSLQVKAEQHHKAASHDIGLDGYFENLSDVSYDRAIEAARKSLTKDIESEYQELVEAIEKLGVTAVPSIEDWPKPERPM